MLICPNEIRISRESYLLCNNLSNGKKDDFDRNFTYFQ